MCKQATVLTRDGGRARETSTHGGKDTVVPFALRGREIRKAPEGSTELSLERYRDEKGILGRRNRPGKGLEEDALRLSRAALEAELVTECLLGEDGARRRYSCKGQLD